MGFAKEVSQVGDFDCNQNNGVAVKVNKSLMTYRTMHPVRKWMQLIQCAGVGMAYQRRLVFAFHAHRYTENYDD